MIAVADSLKEATWIEKVLSDFNIEIIKPWSCYEDNQSTIANLTNGKQDRRMKHIDVRYHFVHEYVEDARVSLIYKPTSEMYADMLTKPLFGQKIKDFMQLLGFE